MKAEGTVGAPTCWYQKNFFSTYGISASGTGAPSANYFLGFFYFFNSRVAAGSLTLVFVYICLNLRFLVAKCNLFFLQADPCVLALPRLGPHNFYETGRHLLKFAPADEAEDLGNLLVELLKSRFKMIYDDAANSELSSATSAGTTSQSVLDKLDVLERTLYAVAKVSVRGIQDWVDRKTDNIATAALVEKHLSKKRKAWVL
jgi:hypothetical protein